MVADRSGESGVSEWDGGGFGEKRLQTMGQTSGQVPSIFRFLKICSKSELLHNHISQNQQHVLWYNFPIIFF